MNRKQRRDSKKAQPNRYTLEQLELAKLIYLRSLLRGRFNPGDKVKLDLEMITSSPDWERKEQKYKEWCKTHAEDELTVIYDTKYLKQPELVCLEEDTTNPRWLFSVIDLKPVSEDDNFRDMIDWIRASQKNN